MRILLDTNINLVAISARSVHHWVIQKLVEGQFELAVFNEILLIYFEIIEQKMDTLSAEFTHDLLDNLPNVFHKEPKFKWPLLIDEYDEKFSK